MLQPDSCFVGGLVPLFTPHRGFRIVFNPSTSELYSEDFSEIKKNFIILNGLTSCLYFVLLLSSSLFFCTLFCRSASTSSFILLLTFFILGEARRAKYV